MLKPLQQWICDMCNCTIEDANVGYIIWKNDDQKRSFEFRVIHKKQCDQSREYPCSMSLETATGPGGLSVLLSQLSLGPFMSPRGDSEILVANIDEYVDLIRRLHLPHYEEARIHFNNERLRSEMGGANEIYPYCVDKLQEIIQDYGEHVDR